MFDRFDKAASHDGVQPGDLLLVLVLALPVVQWISLNPNTDGHVTTYTGSVCWAVTALLILAAWIGQADAPLGWLVAWETVLVLRHQTTEAYQGALFLAFGCIGLLSVARFDARRRRFAVRGLLIVGTVEAVLGVLQLVFNPGWQPAFALQSNANYFGALMAILTPLAPGWLIPLLLAGVVSSLSWTALAAVTVGLLVRYAPMLWAWFARASFWARVGLIGAGSATAAGICTLTAMLKPNALGGASARVDVWALALRHLNDDWTRWIAGIGPGRWKVLVQYWQAKDGVAKGDYFIHAHNEWLQMLVQDGVVALGFVAWWCWRHRASVAGEYAGAVAAMAVAAAGTAVFHLPDVGLVALAVLGLALSAERENNDDRRTRSAEWKSP